MTKARMAFGAGDVLVPAVAEKAATLPVAHVAFDACGKREPRSLAQADRLLRSTFRETDQCQGKHRVVETALTSRA